MNKAIAAAYATGFEAALEELHSIKGLENYYLYHTAIGEMYFEMGKKADAKKYFAKALTLTRSLTEQQLLHEKMMLCEG